MILDFTSMSVSSVSKTNQISSDTEAWVNGIKDLDIIRVANITGTHEAGKV